VSSSPAIGRAAVFPGGILLEEVRRRIFASDLSCIWESRRRARRLCRQGAIAEEVVGVSQVGNWRVMLTAKKLAFPTVRGALSIPRSGGEAEPSDPWPFSQAELGKRVPTKRGGLDDYGNTPFSRRGEKTAVLQ